MRNRDRYPRTLEEAFGPYQRGPITNPDEPEMSWQDALVLWASFIAAVALIVIVINPGGIFNGNT